MVDFLLLMIRVSAPLILIALAGYMSERGGIINIGLEGKTLLACFLCAAASLKFGAIAGVIAGIGGATLLSILHWNLTQTFRIDQIISGMAINLFAAGATSFLKSEHAASTMTDAQRIPMNIYYGFAIVSPLAFWWFANHTRFGLQHRSVGSDPEKARLLGVNPLRLRLISMLFVGTCCGLAGCLLVSDVQTFTDGMTSGRGYIALAALILAGWRPHWTGAACLLFGLATAVQIKFNGQFGIPSEVYKSLPYVITLIALTGLVGKNRAPGGLGKI